MIGSVDGVQEGVQFHAFAFVSCTTRDEWIASSCLRR